MIQEASRGICIFQLCKKKGQVEGCVVRVSGPCLFEMDPLAFTEGGIVQQSSYSLL